VGKGTRDWGEIQWIIQVDRRGGIDGSGKLDSFVTKRAFVDV